MGTDLLRVRKEYAAKLDIVHQCPSVKKRDHSMASLLTRKAQRSWWTFSVASHCSQTRRPYNPEGSRSNWPFSLGPLQLWMSGHQTQRSMKIRLVGKDCLLVGGSSLMLRMSWYMATAMNGCLTYEPHRACGNRVRSRRSNGMEETTCRVNLGPGSRHSQL